MDAGRFGALASVWQCVSVALEARSALDMGQFLVRGQSRGEAATLPRLAFYDIDYSDDVNK
jgi:hypothetical protein